VIKQIMTAEQAALLFRDGDTVVLNGFGSIMFPEAISIALGNRFVETGHPVGMTYVCPAGQGIYQEDHMGEFMCREGMLKKIYIGHIANMMRLQRLIVAEKVEAYNLPMGVVSHLIRASAGRKAGILTKVGMHTFIDPRISGGALNQCSTEKVVRLMNIDNEEYLFYKAPKITVALLRGTSADPFGNITIEKEAINGDLMSSAMAAKAYGGKVIVQVERLMDRRAEPRLVKIPGNLVDAIVVAPDQKQSYLEQYNATLTGEYRLTEEQVAPMLEHIKALGAKDSTQTERNVLHEVIARRAAMEIEPGSLVNLGIGIPELIPNAARTMGTYRDITLTVESGIIGGFPASGLCFGSVVNPDCIVEMDSIFDMYDGRYLDAVFVGVGEVDQEGNVNVSRIGSKVFGVGGFVNLTQSGKKIVYCFPFTGSACRLKIECGKMTICQEGDTPKFRSHVEQISSSGAFALECGQKVLFITERCVMELCPEGMVIREVAPGITLERDIFPYMEFRPHVATDLKTMPAEIFRNL